VSAILGREGLRHLLLRIQIKKFIMDPTEKLVCVHLKHRGFTNIIYEPDGNIPPDFLVNGTIAIEVRRLNQNYFDEIKAKGLEEVAIPLSNQIKNLLGSLGAPVNGESWFVFFRFKRPIEQWRSLEPKLLQALKTFIASPVKQKGGIYRSGGFELDVFRASKAHATIFVIGGYSDQDSGGWVLSEMENNIRHCAAEKSRKIEKFRHKYGEWWLGLVDHIGYGLDDFDREMFRAQVSIEHDWDKIILINPTDPTRSFEI
jgi:hypothetical protein